MAIDAATLNILSLGLSFLMGSALVWLGIVQTKSNLHSRMTLVQLGMLFLVNALVFILYIVQRERFTACALREHCHHAQRPDRSEIFVLTMMTPWC